MKKIILAGLITLLLGIFVFAGNFSMADYSMNLNLSKGWNLVPPVQIDNSSGNYNLMEQCEIEYVFMWNPLSQDYYGIKYLPNNQTQTIVGEPFGGYEPPYSTLYNTNATLGVSWMYANKNCSIPSTWGSTTVGTWNETTKQQVEDTIYLAQGWNFLTINPYMVGLNTKDIFQNCNLEAMNYWSPVSQTWSSNSSSDFAQKVESGEFDSIEGSIVTAMVGQTWVVKTNNQCYLNYGSSTTGPPALPN
jgi:hypothetical protein